MLQPLTSPWAADGPGPLLYAGPGVGRLIFCLVSGRPRQIPIDAPCLTRLPVCRQEPGRPPLRPPVRAQDVSSDGVYVLSRACVQVGVAVVLVSARLERAGILHNGLQGRPGVFPLGVFGGSTSREIFGFVTQRLSTLSLLAPTWVPPPGRYTAPRPRVLVSEPKGKVGCVLVSPGRKPPVDVSRDIFGPRRVDTSSTRGFEVSRR